MSDIEKMARRRQLRNAMVVSVMASAALLAGCLQPPAPPPPQPVAYPAPPPPPPPVPVVRG